VIRRSRTPVILDRDAVAQACSSLGIGERVEIEFSHRGAEATTGRLLGWRDGAWRVRLAPGAVASVVSITLWHELAHVMQAEREGGMAALNARLDRELRRARLTGRRQRRWFRGLAYDLMPLEFEAEELAIRGHRRLPLAMRAQRRPAVRGDARGVTV
jgi:hypothetical protein